MKTCCAVLAVLAVLAAVAAPAAAQEQVSSQCLGCICEASSACDTTLGCQNGYCGPFRISNAFFIDSELSSDADFAQTTFRSCATNPFCSAAVIRKYMAKYPRDCNGDGAQTCSDFAMVHQAGPNGCVNNRNVLQSEFWREFQNCLGFFPSA